MKTVNNILRILTLAFSAAGLILFFTEFVTFTAAGDQVGLGGAQMAFGADGLARSPKVLFAMILSLLSVAGAAFSFTKKSKAGRWVQIVTAAVAGIYMLVLALSKPWNFLDLRPYAAPSGVAYTCFPIITAAVILASLAAGIAYILVRDALTAKDGMTIPKKIAKFFKEYKGEVKKIVWPGPKSVVKNTLVVLVICAILGIFIWLLDWGLSSLIDLIV